MGSFVVDLINSGAHGTEFLPVLLEVNLDGVQITSPEGKPIRTFTYGELYGWTVTQFGIRLQTDHVGRYLEMRTDDAEAIAAACSSAAQEHVALLREEEALVEETAESSELMVQQCLEIRCVEPEMRSAALVDILSDASTIQLERVAEGLGVMVTAPPADRDAAIKLIVEHVASSFEYEQQREVRAPPTTHGLAPRALVMLRLCSCPPLSGRGDHPRRARGSARSARSARSAGAATARDDAGGSFKRGPASLPRPLDATSGGGLGPLPHLCQGRQAAGGGDEAICAP